MDVVKNNGWQEIHSAALNGDVEKIKREFKNGVSVDVATTSEASRRSTPLHVACAQGECAAAKQLLELKADINKRDSNGWTPLMMAAFHHQAECVELLLEHKADQTLRTNKTPTGYRGDETAFELANGQTSFFRMNVNETADNAKIIGMLDVPADMKGRPVWIHEFAKQRGAGNSTVPEPDGMIRLGNKAYDRNEFSGFQLLLLDALRDIKLLGYYRKDANLLLKQTDGTFQPVISIEDYMKPRAEAAKLKPYAAAATEFLTRCIERELPTVPCDAVVSM